MLENIGMTIGLLPITGVPLPFISYGGSSMLTIIIMLVSIELPPFISYGGSSMLTNMMMIGLILNVSSQRRKSIFID